MEWLALSCSLGAKKSTDLAAGARFAGEALEGLSARIILLSKGARRVPNGLYLQFRGRHKHEGLCSTSRIGEQALQH